jgi:hypothetical protein
VAGEGLFMKKILFITITCISFAGCSGSSKSSKKDSKLNTESFLKSDLPELHKMLSYVDPEYGVMTKDEEEEIKLMKDWGDMIVESTESPETRDDLRAATTIPTLNSTLAYASFHYYLKTVYEGISAQPELATFYEDAIGDFFTDDKNPTKISQIGKFAGFSFIFSAMARQPEAANTILEYAQSYTGDLYHTDNDLIKVARCYAVGSALVAMSEQPEFANTIKDHALTLMGEAQTISNKEAKAACETYIEEKLAEAVADQPEMEETLNTNLDALM